MSMQVGVQEAVLDTTDLNSASHWTPVLNGRGGHPQAMAAAPGSESNSLYRDRRAWDESQWF